MALARGLLSRSAMRLAPLAPRVTRAQLEQVSLSFREPARMPNAPVPAIPKAAHSPPSLLGRLPRAVSAVLLGVTAGLMMTACTELPVRAPPDPSPPTAAYEEGLFSSATHALPRDLAVQVRDYLDQTEASGVAQKSDAPPPGLGDWRAALRFEANPQTIAAGGVHLHVYFAGGHLFTHFWEENHLESFGAGWTDAGPIPSFVPAALAAMS
jgi:hypothetical protein